MSWVLDEKELRERHLALAGIHNLREVGGYPARGGVTRRGVLLRGDSPHALDSDGLRQLEALGLRTVIDLREQDERDAYPNDLSGIGVQTLIVPLMGEAGHDLTFSEGSTLRELYLMVIRERGVQLAQAVAALASPTALPALVHCTGGKDRTGLVVALVLAAVGVPEDVIVADYGATSMFLSGAFSDAAIARMVERGLTLEQATGLLGSDPADLAAVLEAVQVEHGDVPTYLRAYGITDDQLQVLHDVMVEPAGEDAVR